MNIKTQKYRYRVNADDCLVAVDPLWLAFAQENGASQLTQSSVLGKPLWDFIDGRNIRGIYAKIHARVRSARKPASFQFRCDSPTLRRYMRMTISPGDAGQLQYESRIDRVVPQRRLELLDARARRSTERLEVCSNCNRALLDAVGWLDLEDACFRTGLLEESEVPELRHTLCPACLEAIHNSIGNSDVA